MIRTEKSHLKSYALSHAGMSGKNNEDRFGVSAFLLEDEVKTPVLLSIMADGIGGHNAGEVAAEMVVDLVSRKVAESDGSNPVATLRKAIQGASTEVHSLARADRSRKGMGSTIVCTLIIGKKLYTAYVGDSRIYLIRDGKIQQLTKDHSWIQEALDTGLLTPEQAEGHPNAHVIRRFVGSAEPPEVDFRLRLSNQDSDMQALQNQGTMLKNGDILLLCSDGLTDLVKDHEILSIILENGIEEANQKLVDLANARGGHDNITNVFVKVPEGVFIEKPVTAAPQKLSARRIAIGCLGMLLVAVLTSAGYFGVRWLSGRSSPTPTQEMTTTQLIISTPGEQLTLLPTVGTATTSAPPPTSSIRTVAPSPASSSQEGNIPAPPNKDSMTAVPTSTNTATSSPTATNTTAPGQTTTP